MIEIPATPGGWGTIVVDPPWSFADKGSRASPDWAARRASGYTTMSPEEILALPVGALAADEAHVYLWVTDSHLPLGLRCLETWGLAYKQTIKWVKRGASGKLQMGMGHWWRHSADLCLFAVGKLARARVHNLCDVIEAPRGTHSEKPEALQDAIEKMSPGPRLEIFARRHRPGWVCWGDQLPAESEAKNA